MSAARAAALTWASGVLECVPTAEIHGFTVTADSLAFLNVERCRIEPVPVFTLHVQAAGITDARRLVEAFGLTEAQPPVGHDDCLGVVEIHTWSGWVAEASREAAVLVEVTASERICWTTDITGVAA